jgi:membrane dipeptidase
MEEVDREVAKDWPGKPAPMPAELRMGIDQLVAVIDYWAGLVGDDHVGLGSDLDGKPELPRGMQDIGDYGQVIDAMRRRGYLPGPISGQQVAPGLRHDPGAHYTAA